MKMLGNLMIKIVIIMAVLNMLVSVKFFYHLQSLYNVAAELGMLMNGWDLQVSLLNMIVAVLTCGAVFIRTTKVYFAVIVLLVLESALMIWWFTKLLKIQWFLRPESANTWIYIMSDYPESFIQASIMLVLLFITCKQVIKSRKNSGAFNASNSR